jgi:sigma-B regulation protein RsbQ
MSVGEYLHAHIPGSELVVLRATGHCPHLSDPTETIAAMKAFLGKQGDGPFVRSDAR